ncbi:hypothetical protein JCM10449v2_007311 [Rhodotorula kratochvilovae]
MKYYVVTLAVAAAATLASADSHELARVPSTARCTGTIALLNDVAASVKCATVNIKSFTVPAGKTFELDLADGAVVNLKGDLKFGTKNWEGPLMLIEGKSIAFNGGGHKLDGQGSYYWDGKGGNSGVTKPKFFKVTASGVIANFTLSGFSVSNAAELVMSNIVVDVHAGAKLGHNTDAFDISAAKDLTITQATVYNQDDCVPINDGDGITIQNSSCTGGHGISVGSIKTGKNIKNVVIKNNKIIDNDNGLRIKTYVGATSASVTNVYYTGNTATGCKKYGVIIQQDYTKEGAIGKATSGVPVNQIHFTGDNNTVSVASGAKRVYD